jgi:sec-independent protein translocase protein TatA
VTWIVVPNPVEFFLLYGFLNCYTQHLERATKHPDRRYFEDEVTMTILFANILSPMDLVIIAVVGVLLFGKRLPDVGRYLGKSITEFKKGMKGLEDDLSVSSAPSGPISQPQQAPGPAEAIRPPQRVAATAPKFEDAPAVNPPQV